MKYGSDKEIQAVCQLQKEQRLLEKRDSALRIEKEYALKLLELGSREVRLSQRRLNTNVGKIKSFLTAEEIKTFREQEMTGKFKPAINTVKVSGAFTIAAATKRLKLLSEQRMAAHGMDLDGNPIKGPDHRKQQKMLTERLTKSAPPRRSMRISLQEGTPQRNIIHSLRRANTCTEFKCSDDVFDDETSHATETPKSTSQRRRSMSASEDTLTTLKDSQHDSSEMTKVPDSNSPKTSDKASETDHKGSNCSSVMDSSPEKKSTHDISGVIKGAVSMIDLSKNTEPMKPQDSSQGEISSAESPKVYINPKASSSSPIIQNSTTCTQVSPPSPIKNAFESPKPSVGEPKKAFDKQNSQALRTPATPKNPKSFFSSSSSVKEANNHNERKGVRSKPRPATTCGQAARRERQKNPGYSSHDVMERETREKERSSSSASGIVNARRQSCSQSAIICNSIDDDLAITRAKERRQMLLEVEEEQNSKIMEKQKEFLEKVQRWVDANPSFQPSKKKDPVLSLLQIDSKSIRLMPKERKGRSDSKKLRRMDTFSKKVVIKERADPIEVGWKDLNKCRYLRISDDQVDLTGVVTLASEQMKAIRTLQFGDIEEIDD